MRAMAAIPGQKRRALRSRMMARGIGNDVDIDIGMAASRADHDTPITPADHPKSRSEHELRQRVSKGSGSIMIGLTALLERGDIVGRTSGVVIFGARYLSDGAAVIRCVQQCGNDRARDGERHLVPRK
jgi:hypothetical protein